MAVLVLVAAAAVAAQAPPPRQDPPGATLRFEVASVKPNTSGSTSASSNDYPGRYAAANMALRRLISIAYRMHPVLDRDRIIGPSWIDSARFDINARAPENTPAAQMPDLLRTLLAERFQLAAHLEAREGPVYALVMAREDRKPGAQLRPSTLDCSKPENLLSGGGGVGLGANAPGAGQAEPNCGMVTNVDANGGILRGGGRTMAQLAANLAGRVNRTVIDRTGLTGTYDIVLRWAPDNLSAVGGDQKEASIFTALQEQLGLRLESQQGPVEFLIIDRIERPTPD